MECQSCKREFEPNKFSNARQKYCSAKCKDSIRFRSYTYTCKQCGVEYHPKEKSRKTFCSRECYSAAMAAQRDDWKHLYFRDCIACARRFITTTQQKWVCSSDCSKVRFALKRKAKLRNPNGETRACIECGTTFFLAPGRAACGGRICCSGRCGRAYGRRRRLAEVSNTPVSEIPRAEELLDRDKGICHICGLKVLRHAQPPHLLAPVIDHVWPLAKHGRSDRENLKVAHFLCNSVKGESINRDWYVKRSLRALTMAGLAGQRRDGVGLYETKRLTP